MTKIDNDYWKNREAKRQKSKAQRAMLRDLCRIGCAVGLLTQIAMVAAFYLHASQIPTAAAMIANGLVAAFCAGTFVHHGNLRRNAPWGDDTWTVRDSFSVFTILLLAITSVAWCVDIYSKLPSVNFFLACFAFGLAGFVQVVTTVKWIMAACGWKGDTSTSWSRALDRADDFRALDLYGDASPSYTG